MLYYATLQGVPFGNPSADRLVIELRVERLNRSIINGDGAQFELLAVEDDRPKAVQSPIPTQALDYANKAHTHFDDAVRAMGLADGTGDVRSWQNYLAEARAHVGISRLALELANVPDTRAVRE